MGSELTNHNSTSKVVKPWKQYRGKVPIFAQSVRQNRGGPSNKDRRQAVRKSPSAINLEFQNAAPHPLVKQEINGHDIAGMGTAQSTDPSGFLGPWEPSITNVIHSEEIIRGIMDYLIGIVAPMILKNDPVLDMLEIEAKIGQVMDRDTQGRVRIPVETECVLSRNDPSLKTQFKSSMTETQHSQLNNFLNKSLINSQPPPAGAPSRPGRPRLPLVYAHRYETDNFYDLPPNALKALPPLIQGYLGGRFLPKVRITTDDKTGKELARIIKLKVSDIEVYSPRALFDWRVSVNLEYKYDGDIRDLVKSIEGKDRKNIDRKKNRMSYTHGPYQLDLTQVHKAGTNSTVEKEHELEIELSAATVIEQTRRVIDQQPNGYEDLIKGFVDNVRTVGRYCKDQ
ncbi:MAG: hypothetical protein Q9166_003805 [cf. Caloplaca sp. 2 TL-2023]